MIFFNYTVGSKITQLIVAVPGIAPGSRGSLILTICFQMEWTIPSPIYNRSSHYSL